MIIDHLEACFSPHQELDNFPAGTIATFPTDVISVLKEQVSVLVEQISVATTVSVQGFTDKINGLGM